MRRGSRTAMYFRMLYRAAMLRKGQALSALTAIIVAAAASTAMALVALQYRKAVCHSDVA